MRKEATSRYGQHGSHSSSHISKDQHSKTLNLIAFRMESIEHASNRCCCTVQIFQAAGLAQAQGMKQLFLPSVSRLPSTVCAKASRQ